MVFLQSEAGNGLIRHNRNIFVDDGAEVPDITGNVATATSTEVHLFVVFPSARNRDTFSCCFGGAFAQEPMFRLFGSFAVPFTGGELSRPLVVQWSHLLGSVGVPDLP